ncbi:MAG: AzlC family ABC transporter permease [Rhodospirillales bacterium]
MGSSAARPQVPNPAPGARVFADRRQAFLGGAADALRMPIYVVFGSMLGFGSLAQDLGIGLGVSVVTTATLWGLPGQVAFVELFAVGAPVLAIALASSMANLRFLPMSLGMMPLFRGDRAAWRWRYGLVAMMSVNTWALTMQHGPAMPAEQRVAYFTGLSAVCMTTGVVATALGHHLAGTLPYFVTVSLIFLNPVYFTFLFATVRQRSWVLAIVFGAVLGPVIHLISPEWGLPFCGAIAGTAAYLIDRRMGGGDG